LPKQLLRPKLMGARGAPQKCWDPVLISTTSEGSNFKFGSLCNLGCGNIIQKLLLPPKMAWLWAREHPTNFRVLFPEYFSGYVTKRQTCPEKTMHETTNDSRQRLQDEAVNTQHPIQKLLGSNIKS